ncbi:unnamed protein product, partial [Lymnaea stagnalis]
TRYRTSKFKFSIETVAMGRICVHYILFLTYIILPDVRSEVACNWTDAIPSEGACFLYKATRLSYADAKVSCLSLGGVLAKVTTKTQMLEITKNLNYGACKWTDSIPSEGACFLYNATELSYAEANSSCQSIGGVLAKLKTMTQLLEAIQNVPYTTYIWIGANDISVEGTWMWEDGGVATELNELWYNDEPDNGTDHDCADIYKYFTLSGLYDDVCSKRCPFLCMEKDEITTLCPEASTFKTNSPPTTELTTNELAATEPTAKAILTST